MGANKNAITTIGLAADKYAQAYFSYDSMKSGGLTQSHLRFGDQPIHATYLVSAGGLRGRPTHPPMWNKYDTTADLKDGGTYLLNCPWSAEELEERLPAKMKRDLATSTPTSTSWTPRSWLGTWAWATGSTRFSRRPSSS